VTRVATLVVACGANPTVAPCDCRYDWETRQSRLSEWSPEMMICKSYEGWDDSGMGCHKNARRRAPSVAFVKISYFLQPTSIPSKSTKRVFKDGLETSVPTSCAAAAAKATEPRSPSARVSLFRLCASQPAPPRRHFPRTLCLCVAAPRAAVRARVGPPASPKRIWKATTVVDWSGSTTAARRFSPVSGVKEVSPDARRPRVSCAPH
jgi:hypothetical protein